MKICFITYINAIKNSVTGNDTTFDKVTDNLPATGKIEEFDTPYVTFRTAEHTSNPKNAIKITDAGFKNQNALTFETWIKPTKWGEGVTDSIFSMYSGTKCIMSTANYMDTNINSPDNDASMAAALKLQLGTSTVAPHNNEWTHMVLTRVWTPDSDGSGNGKWSCKVYLNGKLAGSTQSETSSARRTEDNDVSIYLGSATNAGGYTYYGSVGDFKVYQTELTAKKIASKYAESVGFFKTVQEEVDAETEMKRIRAKRAKVNS